MVEGGKGMAEVKKGLVYHSFGSRQLRVRSPYMQGTDVKVLQCMLNKMPEDFIGQALAEDGMYGPATERAVKNFQLIIGIRVDGIVGPQTFYALGKEIGKYIEEKPEFGSRDLRLGMEGGDVRVLQNRLNALGRRYARIIGGPADGVFGSRTRRAVRRFQQDFRRRCQGMLANGIVGPDTFDTLYVCTFMGGRTLKQCADGYDTYWLQWFLQRCGRYEGKLDGRFGPLTDMAVRSFQSSRGISVDGIVGRETFFMIGMSMARWSTGGDSR